MNVEYRYIESNFMGHSCYTFVMKAKDLLPIQYVAVRGGSTEQGAVQRVLNKRRINDIKDFVLQGNSFVNSFILNWTDVNNQPKIKKDSIILPLQGRRVQMLDGQHRIAGIQEAVNMDSKYGDLDVLVSMFIDLKTSDAAKIFLNINSEQKPVPKSLIYDLFGEAVEDSAHVINRVKDIIDELNTNRESPYFQMVRYPSPTKQPGLIDLSIMVNAMKPHFEKDGAFAKYKLMDIELQQRIILNFYSAIRDAYTVAKIWDKKSENPFMKAAGFSGAFDFLVDHLISRCQTDRNFTKQHMSDLMKLEDSYLITQTDIKSSDGKSGRKKVASFFYDLLSQDLPQNLEEYEL